MTECVWPVPVGTLVMTPKGKGVVTKGKDVWAGNYSCVTRQSVRLFKKPPYYKTKVLWFYKMEILPL